MAEKTAKTEKALDHKNNQWKNAAGLFLYFFRIGWYTFGGGLSIVAQIQHDYVEKKHALTNEELLDLTSVGRSLPGVMVGNVSLLFGYHMAGVPGALLSVLGLSLPPIAILTLVTYLYTWFRENEYVARALKGVRACVVPVMFSATMKMYPAALRDWINYVILFLGVLLLLFTDISAILIIFGAALTGLLVSFLRRKRGGLDA